MNRRRSLAVLAVAGVALGGALASPGRRAFAQATASLTVAQVRARLKAMPGHANFSNARLFALDLDGLDFRGANFTNANLTETNMRDANLAGATFIGAYLSGTKFAHSDLHGARFGGATFLTTAEAANFRGADVSHTSGYLIAPGGDFTGANFAHARLRPDLSNQPMGLLHTIFAQTDLTRTNFSGADLGFADLSSAKVVDATLRGTSFDQANLSRAVFSGSDVTGAIFSKADIGGADFRRVRGRSAMRGLATALNRDQALF